MEIRKAIRYAIDFDTIANTVYMGMAKRTDTPLPAGTWMFSSSSAVTRITSSRLISFPSIVDVFIFLSSFSAQAVTWKRIVVLFPPVLIFIVIYFPAVIPLLLMLPPLMLVG